MRITFQAFFCAVVLGTLIAFLFVQSRFLEISLFPYALADAAEITHLCDWRAYVAQGL